MKKHPSKKKDNKKTSEFLTSSSDEEFTALMERSGVAKLKAEKKEKTASKKEENVDESIQFEKTSGVVDFLSSTKGSKYTRQSEKKPKTSRRTKKLRPGFTPDLELDLHGYTQKEALVLGF